MLEIIHMTVGLFLMLTILLISINSVMILHLSKINVLAVLGRLI